jgi:hypothetical protein
MPMGAVWPPIDVQHALSNSSTPAFLLFLLAFHATLENDRAANRTASWQHPASLLITRTTSLRLKNRPLATVIAYIPEKKKVPPSGGAWSDRNVRPAQNQTTQTSHASLAHRPTHIYRPSAVASWLKPLSSTKPPVSASAYPSLGERATAMTSSSIRAAIVGVFRSSPHIAMARTDTASMPAATFRARPTPPKISTSWWPTSRLRTSGMCSRLSYSVPSAP